MGERLRKAVVAGLLLLFCQGGWGQDDALRFTVRQFVVSGSNPLGDRALDILKPYLGPQYGLDGLSAAADALEQALIDAGYSFHRVSLPPQTLDQGRVELKVVAFTLGKIEIKGNRFFDRDNVLHALPQLEAGRAPNTRLLGRSLDMANEHPARKLKLTFRQSEQADAIDAAIRVEDSDPQVYFVNIDNSGAPDAKAFRSTIGYQHSNLFNRDHALTATLTFAPEDPSSTRQIGLNYQVPLYAHGAFIDVLLSDSEVNSGTVAQNVAVSGKGSVFGISYRRPLSPRGALRHDWHAGLQYRLFRNTLTLNGNPTETRVLSQPLELGYHLNYRASRAVIDLELSLAGNIDSGPYNQPADYQLARPGAVPGWRVLRYRLGVDAPFGKGWLLHLGVNGQSGGDRLIPGEQFGVGGAASLRGFEERSVSADRGLQQNLELWTPGWKGARALLFYDAARLQNNALPNTSEPEQSLSSWGMGLRWTWKRRLSIALDYGVIIHGGGNDPAINRDGDRKTHFNLIYRF